MKSQSCDTTGDDTRMKQNETPHAPILSTYERRQHMIYALEELQRASVTELSKRFSVSEVTVRKDLAWMEERKLIIRTHGGALLVHSTLTEQGFEAREYLQYEEKDRIGRLAASLVQDGDSIALDSSTTALAMARYLKEQRELTVLTNGLRTGLELVNTPGVAVMVPSGMLRRESLSLVGAWSKAVLQQINIKTAFVSARGLTLKEGLTEVNNEEVAYKKIMVEAAREVVVLIDHSKWGHMAFATFCALECVTRIITDDKAPEKMLKEVRKRGVEVQIAK